MHELSVCQALIAQVKRIANSHGAERVERVSVAIGPLSGIEAPLLERAWPLAVAGTLAQDAELVVASSPVRVRCTICGAQSEATPNRLLCASCGEWRTQLLGGNEMYLTQVQLAVPVEAEM